jgi:hypothetical protein
MLRLVCKIYELSEKLKFQIDAGNGQTCICVTPGFCSLANGVAPDGSGALDPRIVGVSAKYLLKLDIKI